MTLFPGLPNIMSLTSSKYHIIKCIFPTPAHHLFNIVTDVNNYSNFLPFCKSSQIMRWSNCGTMFDASLRVGLIEANSNKKCINNSWLLLDYPSSFLMEEEYISRVKTRVNRNLKGIGRTQWMVETKSIDSKFLDKIKSRWTINELKTSKRDPPYSEFPDLIITNNQKKSKKMHSWCKVKFELEMKVSNPIIRSFIDKLVEEVANIHILAFERRCSDVPFNI